MCHICGATPAPTAASTEGVVFELLEPDDMDQA